VEIERGEVLGAKHDGKKERVARRDGKVIEMREDLIENVKHRVKPVGRNGMGGRLFFGMSGSTAKYVRGPDGLDFIWNDGWDPAPLYTKNVEGPQRDPDGGVWVKVNGDWELEA
jgi:hypothetical protein